LLFIRPIQKEKVFMLPLDPIDLFLLRDLPWSGRSLYNYVYAQPIALDKMIASLVKLEKAKLITLKGKKTLSQLAFLSRRAEPQPAPLVAADGKTWRGLHAALFAACSQREKWDYFDTRLRLTLRGHARLLLTRRRPTTLDVAGRIEPSAPPLGSRGLQAQTTKSL
jgi:hypothetical protein